jgi:hypothetical protein
MNWINRKDRLPEYGQYVLVYYCGDNWGQDGYHRVKVARFERDERNNDNNYYWDCGCNLELFGQDVSHWMPLPTIHEIIRLNLMKKINIEKAGLPHPPHPPHHNTTPPTDEELE